MIVTNIVGQLLSPGVFAAVKDLARKKLTLSIPFLPGTRLVDTSLRKETYEVPGHGAVTYWAENGPPRTGFDLTWFLRVGAPPSPRCDLPFKKHLLDAYGEEAGLQNQVGEVLATLEDRGCIRGDFYPSQSLYQGPKAVRIGRLEEELVWLLPPDDVRSVFVASEIHAIQLSFISEARAWYLQQLSRLGYAAGSS